MIFSSVIRNGLNATKIIFEKSIGSTSVLIIDNSIDSKRKIHTIKNGNDKISNYMIKNNNSIMNKFRQISPVLAVIREYSKKSKPDYESDSDSDDELDYHRKYPNNGNQKERGNSEFWRRKMRTLHGILDVNNDGVISYDDFMLLAKNFADLGHLSPTTYNEFKEVMHKTWEEQWGEVTPYNLVTAEQFLTDMHHVLNDKDLVKKIHRLLPFLFKAVDTNHSGHINLEQYKLFFRCLGLTDEDAAVSFAAIDENGDGKLSLKEFVKLGKDFFLTENERKVSRMFWGPLVNH